MCHKSLSWFSCTRPNAHDLKYAIPWTWIRRRGSDSLIWLAINQNHGLYMKIYIKMRVWTDLFGTKINSTRENRDGRMPEFYVHRDLNGKLVLRFIGISLRKMTGTLNRCRGPVTCHHFNPCGWTLFLGLDFCRATGICDSVQICALIGARLLSSLAL